MVENLESLVICDAVRTPFCHGNQLKEYRPEDLLETILRALIKRNNLKPDSVSSVVTGCVLQDTRVSNIARIASMKAGLSEKLSDYSVQMNCNSGFMGLLTAIGGIAAGMGDVYISAGVESMSNYGFRLEDMTRKFGTVQEIDDLLSESGMEFLKNFKIVDCLWEGLSDDENDISMIEIAEIMANCFKISREEQDEYTLDNLKRAVDAILSGKLNNYIIPLGKEAEEDKKDSYPLNRKRLIKHPEKFSRTAAVFGEENPELNPASFYEKHKNHLEKYGLKKIMPSVTMYNSCIPGDGAGGCILTTEEKAKSLGLKPLIRIINWAAVGVDPVIMGIGPMEAAHQIITDAKTKRAEEIPFDNIDIIEIHEAFASQVLSVFKESKQKHGHTWAPDKVNAYGGSLAYTHPLGATNFRLLTNILTRFNENPDAKYAMACGCAGGGQGTALLFERY